MDTSADQHVIVNIGDGAPFAFCRLYVLRGFFYSLKLNRLNAQVSRNREDVYTLIVIRSQDFPHAQKPQAPCAMSMAVPPHTVRARCCWPAVDAGQPDED